MEIYYYYYPHYPRNTFGAHVGEIIDRASSYWNRMGYDVVGIRIRAYAIIYTIRKCYKNIKEEP